MEGESGASILGSAWAWYIFFSKKKARFNQQYLYTVSIHLFTYKPERISPLHYALFFALPHSLNEANMVVVTVVVVSTGYLTSAELPTTVSMLMDHDLVAALQLPASLAPRVLYWSRWFRHAQEWFCDTLASFHHSQRSLHLVESTGFFFGTVSVKSKENKR